MITRQFEHGRQQLNSRSRLVSQAVADTMMICTRLTFKLITRPSDIGLPRTCCTYICAPHMNLVSEDTKFYHRGQVGVYRRAVEMRETD